MMAMRWIGCLLLAATLANSAPVGMPGGALAADDARYFPETGYAVRGAFLRYWEAHGGLRQQGFPLTDEFEEVNPTTGQVFRVQYFERARFERHPEYAGTEHEVLLGLIGREQLLARYPGGAPPGNEFPGACFPETGHCLSIVFFDYWLTHGGLPQFGYPLTREFDEVSPTNGQTYRVQYFERARFELHHSAEGGTFVLLGLLGREQFLAEYPHGWAPTRGIVAPADNERVTIPLHLFARVGEPGEAVVATLRWGDGTEHAQRFTLLRGEDGRGLLIGNLDWTNFYDLDTPPPPPTQPATLTIHADAPVGGLLGAQRVTVIGPGDPDLQAIQVYWTISGTELVGPQPRYIPRTVRVGTAALEELLWGPPAISQVGYRTALPMPEEVLAFPGRQPDWGPRVTLRSLEIADGVATADFSRELLAYGGGSLRVKLISDQIRLTLLQFPTVREVRITIEGRDDLQP